MERPTTPREVVGHLRTAYKVSDRRACAAMGFPRSTSHYRSQRLENPRIQTPMVQRVAGRSRFANRRLQILLRRESVTFNHEKIYRLFREEGLSVQPKRRKHAALTRRVKIESVAQRQRR